MRSRLLYTHILFIFFLFSFQFSKAFGQQEAPATAPVARYKQCIVRAPFYFHTEGRTRLAESKTSEALQILGEDYGKTKNYTEYSRYTLASLIGKNFNDDEFLVALDKLREAYSKPIDTWLWVNALTIKSESTDEGHQEVLTLASESKNALHRAAAIAALGESKKGDIKSAIVQNCVNFPKREFERNILLGAMSGALWEKKSRVNDADYRVALTAYVGLLGDEVGLSKTAKLQIARHLQWILGGPALFQNPEPWLELLSRGEVKKPTASATVASPRFFGIETEGERFCYVVDMSDSMCIKIDPSSKPGGPVTGPREKKKKILDESDLPWHKIETRWDLAREQLKVSLSRLSDDKYFSIVWFGTSSGTLESCNGMIKATPANIARVLKELDSIKTGAPDPAKAPDGILRGSTNLHSGLRRAFGLSNKGFAEKEGYVDDDTLVTGCDTVFLLSDGAPSSDDFHTEDKDYGEGRVVLDTEYGAAAPRSERLIYPGPYVRDEWLIEDLRRMNAFRRIRMHCIGLGEANMGLLSKLAELGNGEVFIFGKRKGK